MESIIQQIQQIASKPEDLIRMIILVSNQYQADRLQKSFIRHQANSEGAIPYIIPINHPNITLEQNVNASSDPYSISSIIQLVNQINHHTKNILKSFILAENVLKTLRICEKYSSSIEDLPFNLKTQTKLAQNIWQIAQEFWHLHYENTPNIWRNIDQLFQNFPSHTFLLLDTYPSLHFPALDTVRDQIQAKPLPLTPCLTFDSKHSIPSQYYEWSTPHDEAVGVALEIKHLFEQKNAKIAVISDQMLLINHIYAELIALRVPVQNYHTTPSLAPHAAGALLYAIAKWQINPTPLNLLSIFKNSFLTRYLSADFKTNVDHFAQQIVKNSSEIIDGKIISPLTASIEETQQLIQKKQKKQPSLEAWFNKIITHLHPFPQEPIPLTQALSIYQETLLQLLALTEEPNHAFKTFISSLQFDQNFDSDLTISQQEYLNLVQFLISNTQCSINALSNYDLPISEHPVIILSPQQAFDFKYDIAFLPGMDAEAWFAFASFGLFLQPAPLLTQSIENDTFQYICSHAHVQISRAAGTDKTPHRFLYHIPKIQKINPVIAASYAPTDPSAIATPPIYNRPTTFSITDLQLLNDDPYAFYAKKILKLYPLLSSNLAMDYGRWSHFVLDQYFKQNGIHSSISMYQFVQRVAEKQSLLSRRFFPRLAPILKEFDHELASIQPKLARILTEHPLTYSFKIDGIFYEIKGIADRIDIFNPEENAKIIIIDYKTSVIPSVNQLTQLDSLQLPLEALIMSRNQSPSMQIYIRLQQLKSEIGKTNQLNLEISPAFLQKTEQKLHTLLEKYMKESYTFESTSDHKKRSKDYEHLERLLS